MKKLLLKVFNSFRRLMQRLLTRPVTWAASKFSSSPDRQQVFAALSKLYAATIQQPSEKKGAMLQLHADALRVIIFSDQHKGTRNGADDFSSNEAVYLQALDYYHQQEFYYISLGDSEELWENNILAVLKANKLNVEKERLFVDRGAFFKVYGNHDALWRFDPFAPMYLKQMYGQSIPVYGGMVLRTLLGNGQSLDIFCAHGHQGDTQSDNNWLSAWFVSNIWAPLQNFLRINPNTPACNDEQKSLHNQFMYEWSATQEQVVLITGHTHQPVFKSLTHLERLLLQLEQAIASKDAVAEAAIRKEIPKRQQQYAVVNEAFRQLLPAYFNTGCCCYNNGHITGIELSDGNVRLVKWWMQEGKAQRTVAEECSLQSIADALSKS